MPFGHRSRGAGKENKAVINKTSPRRRSCGAQHGGKMSLFSAQNTGKIPFLPPVDLELPSCAHGHRRRNQQQICVAYLTLVPSGHLFVLWNHKLNSSFLVPRVLLPRLGLFITKLFHGAPRDFASWDFYLTFPCV